MSLVVKISKKSHCLILRIEFFSKTEKSAVFVNLMCFLFSRIYGKWIGRKLIFLIIIYSHKRSKFSLLATIGSLKPLIIYQDQFFYRMHIRKCSIFYLKLFRYVNFRLINAIKNHNLFEIPLINENSRVRYIWIYFYLTSTMSTFWEN